MILSDFTIVGSKENSFDEENIEWDYGLDLIRNVTFDTHFVRRDRLSRLLNFTSKFPENMGIGIEEDTGVIYNCRTQEFEVVGNGYVTVVEPPKRIRDEKKKTEREGYQVSIFTDGTIFKLKKSARMLFLSDKR